MKFLPDLSAFRVSEPEHEVDGDSENDQPRIVMVMVVLVLSCFLVWAYFASLDEVARAPGEVIASSRTQLLQSQDGGVIEEILVREGDLVSAGQLLARIDRTRHLASYLESRAMVASFSARSSRLLAEVMDEDPVFSDILNDYPDFIHQQMRLLERRRSSLSDEVSALENVEELLQRELSMNMPLLDSGDVSFTEVLRLQRQLAETRSQITNLVNNFFSQAQNELSQVRAELEASKNQLAQRRSLLEQTELRAPLNGIVKDVRVHTVGGVVRPGDDVLQIVPVEDDLLIEARVNPRDIAFLSIGQQVAVKIDAYDPSIYGDLSGTLVFISADTLVDDQRHGDPAPFYRVRVKTDGRRFHKVPDRDLEIQPGMTATIEILTGKRTVLQYLTKPITKTLGEAMGER